MDNSEGDFIARICLLFNLGEPEKAVMAAMPGNANRLWQLHTDRGTFVVKEFRYTVEDKRWVTAIRRAAEFEIKVWKTRRVPMAQPIRGKDGSLIYIIIGSRGSPAAVRLHRWLDGRSVSTPVPIQTAAKAGSLLSDIHTIGSGFATSDRGTLRWWRWNPEGILLRLLKVGLLDVKTAEVGRTALSDAERLITAGENTPGRWIFSHYDHKPENTLSIANEFAVLDWDEAALCHPRLEAIESALRWAGITEGKAHACAFAAFIKSYQDHGEQLGNLKPSDFAKWVASIVGWFEYLGRRALREFDDNNAEAIAAAQGAATVIASLGPTLTEVPTWSTWEL